MVILRITMGLLSIVKNLIRTKEVEVLPPHTHSWSRIIETYAPPRRDINIQSIANIDTLNKTILGQTTFLFECAICQQRHTETMFGSENPQLDDTLDKVELYGPQYMQRNGTVFLFQKYQPTPAGTLPIR